MKSIIKYTAAAVLLSSTLLLSSCEDLLEPKIYTDMTPSNFFKSEGDIDAAVTGIYLPCTTNWGYSDGGTGNWYASLFNADEKTYYTRSMFPTDELIPVNTGSAMDIYEFNFGPSTFQGSSQPVYNAIRFVARATDVINQIEKATASTEDIRNRYIAESKTLRALYMYVLYDFFGPVNVKLDPSTLGDNTITPRPSEEEYIGYIEKDLDAAIACTTFPDKYNGDSKNWGRMSKGIAHMIQLRLYMHKKEWAKAQVAAKAIMGMGYQLLPEYKDAFVVKMNNEQIFGIPANSASDNFWMEEVLPNDFNNGKNHLGGTYARTSGWGVFMMQWSYYDKFEDSDKRKATILCEYVNNKGERIDRNDSRMRGAIPLKYVDEQAKGPGNQKDLPLFRYAEVLLSLAEAINEQNGPTAEAIDLVKQVTNRAGTEIPASAMTGKENFRNFLLDERGRELYCEGMRRQDLIRHGKFISGAKARGVDAKEHQVLFPIPQDIIIEGGGVVTQNNGYTN